MCKTNHAGLPQVLDHAVHPVRVGWGGVVAYVILVSPQSQLDLDLDFGLLWDRVWV